MKILSIDTSGRHASAAIIFDGSRENIIGEISLNAKHTEKAYTHSETLMPAIEHLFALTGQTVDEITHIAYTCGPGSFTGLRIGASSALGLSKALNIPAVAVPTLDALAFNVSGMGFDGDICPMLDARRGQVYAALYDNKFNILMGYSALTIHELEAKIRGSTLFVGDGAAANENVLLKIKNAAVAPDNVNFVRASSVGLRALNYIKNDVQTENKMIYVRPPQAVMAQTAIFSNKALAANL